MKATSRYEVIVGNVGNIYTGESGIDAASWFSHGKRMVRQQTGEARGERVTMMKDHEIVKEYVPPAPRMKMTRKHKLAMMLYTASCWHGDTGQGPVAMLSLSSTRKVHTADHRRLLETEIAEDIDDCVKAVLGDGFDANLNEIRQLVDLWDQVRNCKIGEEWLSDDENLRYGEDLYQAGMLDND